jgi:hypothetical protein
MLTDEQIGYLLQIRDTEPKLPERTVRVMLGALRWSPEVIEKGVEFLRIPPASEEAKPQNPKIFKEPDDPEVLPFKPIDIKQNPFPIGSPLIRKPNISEGIHKKKISPIAGGLIVGIIVFAIWLLLYAQL